MIFWNISIALLLYYTFETFENLNRQCMYVDIERDEVLQVYKPYEFLHYVMHGVNIWSLVFLASEEDTLYIENDH